MLLSYAWTLELHMTNRNKNSTLYYIILITGFLAVIYFIYLKLHTHLDAEGVRYLSPPSLYNWFGTDNAGHDIFLKTIRAFIVEILTLLFVLPIIYFLGLFIGMLLSYFSRNWAREFLLNFIHYWVTLPVLLIALFLLILTGAGQINVLVIMVFVIVPTQALYIYNKVESVKKYDFVLCKMSYGLSKPYIYMHHLFPNIKNEYINYTLSRMPELIMMNIALNFLGLGVQPPNSSFGRMLYDGMSYMLSAWWMWLFVVGWIILLFLLIDKLKSSFGDSCNEF